jgi:hypothetical protein
VVSRASAPVFLFCAPELIFGGTDVIESCFNVFASGHILGGAEGVRPRFHVLHSRTRFQRFRGRQVSFSCFASSHSFSTMRRASGPVFMFCAPGHVFAGSEGVCSCFHVLRDRSRFRQYRRRRVPFSCVALTDTFSVVRRASDPIFRFCVPGLVFNDTEGVMFSFHVLRPRTHFRRYRGRQLPFSCFALLDMFSAVRTASCPVFMFCPYNSFSTLLTASGPIFMFCAPENIFDGADGVGSRFDVLRSRTRFPWYRGRQILFSCFALPNSFSVVEGVRSRFHVLHPRTHFRRYRGGRFPF